MEITKFYDLNWTLPGEALLKESVSQEGLFIFWKLVVGNTGSMCSQAIEQVKRRNCIMLCLELMTNATLDQKFFADS